MIFPRTSLHCKLVQFQFNAKNTNVAFSSQLPGIFLKTQSGLKFPFSRPNTKLKLQKMLTIVGDMPQTKPPLSRRPATPEQSITNGISFILDTSAPSNTKMNRFLGSTGKCIPSVFASRPALGPVALTTVPQWMVCGLFGEELVTT